MLRKKSSTRGVWGGKKGSDHILKNNEDLKRGGIAAACKSIMDIFRGKKWGGN